MVPTFHEQKMSGKASKLGKKAIAFFSGKCHNLDILGKKHANLVNLCLNRRFMGGYYSTRFGWRRNALSSASFFYKNQFS